MPLSVLLLAAVPVAWLVPNHYFPWLSAWQDGWAFAMLFGAALLHGRAASLPRSWLALLALALLSVLGQWLGGRILFGGDALMAAFYLGAFMLAIAMGSTLAALDGGPGSSALDVLAAVTLSCAAASVGIALVQWTGALSLGIYGADLTPGHRPYANVAQANHLCTVVFMGLCSQALLRETGRVGAVGFWAGASFLVAGMVMTASRTGWVQMLLLLLLVAPLQRRSAARVRLRDAALLAAIYAIGTWAWPLLNDALLLSGGRSVLEQAQGGVRGPIWWVLLHAVAHEPLWGYGWTQAGMALTAAALEHAPQFRYFEHSHNLALDLLLWAGVPVGGAMLALGGAWLLQAGRRLRDARALWLLAAVVGVLAHAMLEYPHTYAYFLLPTGLAIGAVHGLGAPASGVAWPAVALRAAGGVGAIVLGALALEYLQAEQSYRLLRLESARIGTERIESQAPSLHLLTQLSAFQAFARTEARPGMSAAELESLRRVAQRYPQPPVLLRYALAAGLNGQPEQAGRALALLCSIHPEARCTEGREAWAGLQQRYPQLLGIALPQ